MTLRLILPSSFLESNWQGLFLVSVNALNMHVRFLGSFSLRSATKKNAELDISNLLKDSTLYHKIGVSSYLTLLYCCEHTQKRLLMLR